MLAQTLVLGSSGRIRAPRGKEQSMETAPERKLDHVYGKSRSRPFGLVITAPFQVCERRSS